MTPRTALKGFPKQQFFGNRCENTQQNGEHNCFCSTPWAQISWRVLRFLLWLPISAVVGPLLPTEIRLVDVFISVFIIQLEVKIDHSQNWSGARASQNYPRRFFSRQQTMLWSLKYINNVSFGIWHLIKLNNSNVDWVWNLFYWCPGWNILVNFQPTYWILLLWETQCEMQSIKLLFVFVFLFINQHTQFYVSWSTWVYKMNKKNIQILIFIFFYLSVAFIWLWDAKISEGVWRMADSSQNGPTVHFSREISGMQGKLCNSPTKLLWACDYSPIVI